MIGQQVPTVGACVGPRGAHSRSRGIRPQVSPQRAAGGPWSDAHKGTSDSADAGAGLCVVGAVWAPMAAAACSPLLGDGSWCPRTLAGVLGGRASGRAHGTHREARDPLLASSFGPGPLRPLRSVTTRCPGEAAWPAGQLRLCPAAGAALVHLGARRGSVAEGGPGGGTLGGRGPDGRSHTHGPQPGHRLFFIQSVRPTAPVGGSPGLPFGCDASVQDTPAEAWRVPVPHPVPPHPPLQPPIWPRRGTSSHPPAGGRAGPRP